MISFEDFEQLHMEDPHDIDIKRLKNEYNDIKKEMNKDPQIGI